MGNACGRCCTWIFPRDDTDKDGKRSKSTFLDDENTWFEQDTVPLVSARYDNDDIGSDCVVTKTVVMRSPRATTATSMPSPKNTNRSTPSHDHSTRVRSSDRSSKMKKRPSRGLVCTDKSDDEQESLPASRHAGDPSKRDEPHGSPRRHQASHPCDHTAERSGSSESNRSHGSSSAVASSLTISSNYVVAQYEEQVESKVEANEDADQDDDSRQPSPRSPTKSPKASSSASGGSPKKGRYGRKNYRANSSRKKNA